MKRILVFTYWNFPNGDAGSVRLYSLSRILMELGYEVNIVTMSKIKPFVWNEYNGVRYISLRSEKKDIIHRMGNLVLYNRNVRRVLRDFKTYSAIMLMSLPLNVVLFVEKIAKKLDIPLVTDRTEWYSPSEFPFGVFSFQYLANVIYNSIVVDKYWKVISISHFFEEYYTKKGIFTVRIPAIMDFDALKNGVTKECVNNPRIVVYAGSPARKDSLSMIVNSFNISDINTIQLHVYGVSLESYNKKYGVPGRNYRNVFFHGRVSREQVVAALKTADFSTVFRNPKMRFAKAGFPSKVAECYTLGIPMITNYTSDLQDYLIDGENAVIVQDYNEKSYIEAIVEASKISDEELCKMKKHAALVGKNVFDYKNYKKCISMVFEK